MRESILKSKAKEFALRIIKLYDYLTKNQKEFIQSTQIYRSGTSIVASIAEAQYAQSKADMISKFSISLKEASETETWLELLYSSGKIDEIQYESLNQDIKEIIRMLISSINTLKTKPKK